MEKYYWNTHIEGMQGAKAVPLYDLNDYLRDATRGTGTTPVAGVSYGSGYSDTMLLVVPNKHDRTFGWVCVGASNTMQNTFRKIK